MKDIRKTCPIHFCEAKRNSHCGCCDETCEKYKSYKLCLDKLEPTVREIHEKVYQEGVEKGKADTIEKLKDDYSNCDGLTKCTDCMFSRYGKIPCIFEDYKQNEQIKEQKNE